MASSFGRLLKRRRQAAGYRTQQDLAIAVGVPRSTVGAWESGKQYPGRFIGMLESLLGSLDDEPRLPPQLQRDVRQMSRGQRDLLLALLSELSEDDGAARRHHG